jgi:hypothetical protein
VVFAGGLSGCLLKSTNNGVSWVRVAASTFKNFA